MFYTHFKTFEYEFSPYGITKLFFTDVFREIGNLLFSKIEEENN